jgi:hypothetical protein
MAAKISEVLSSPGAYGQMKYPIIDTTTMMKTPTAVKPPIRYRS